uniref:ribbon-helix-helix domain-containing protein n=1 Tax=Yunchengibacter salinarum TaxID=3133399 RepID=UPI0035B660DC
MTMIEITLPDSLKAWADQQVRSRRYASASDYLCDLVRQDQQGVLWECHELCVSGLAHAGFKHGHALKRSSNMIANWFLAANHSR